MISDTTAEPRVRSRRFLPRRAAVTGVLAMLAVAASAPAILKHAVRAAAPPVEIVGKWRPTTLPPAAKLSEQAARDYWAQAYLYLEPGARRMYAVSGPPTFPWIAAYDLDSLAPVGGGLVLGGYPTSYLPDPTTGGLMMAFLERTSGGRVWIDRYVSTKAGVQRQQVIDLTAPLQGKRLSGIYRLPGTSRMWVIADPIGGELRNARTGGGVTIAELELGADGAASLVWQTVVTDCFAPMYHTTGLDAALGYVPEKKALYFGCANPGGAFFVSPPIARGVGKLTLSGDPVMGRTAVPPREAFTLFARDGEFSRADSVFDHGSGRLVFSASTAVGGAGTTVYVFDGQTDQYVGGIAVGNNEIKSSSVDAVNGRYYGGSPAHATGLVVTDVRTTPVSQGTALPEYAEYEKRSINNGPIAVDPKTRRIFLKYVLLDDFIVAADRQPPIGRSPVPDPDANTLDVDEQPGRTTSNYAGAGQGYGARARQVGGLQGLELNLVGIGHPYPVGPGTREYRGAMLNTLRVTNGEATASAISADRDDNTESDRNRVAPPDGSSPVAWPADAARCLDFGSAPAADTRDTSVVECDAGRKVATAVSKSSARADGGPVFAVQSADLTARSTLDPAKGITSSVESAARGVDVLGGVLKIGSVDAKATSTARGRPGTAASTYERTVRQVRLNGAELCGAQCDLSAIAKRVNEQLVGRVRIDFPEPDRQSKGSPGGAAALIRRSPEEQLAQVLLNEQRPDRIEVPAVVITVYEDGAVPSRTIIELAAVQTEARYAISLIGQGGGGGGGGGEGGGGPLGGNLGGGPGETPLFALPPGTSFPTPLGVQPRGGGGGGLGAGAGRLLWNGISRMADLLPIWAVLLAPIYLSARRWLLLQRGSLLRGDSK